VGPPHTHTYTYKHTHTHARTHTHGCVCVGWGPYRQLLAGCGADGKLSTSVCFGCAATPRGAVQAGPPAQRLSRHCCFFHSLAVRITDSKLAPVCRVCTEGVHRGRGWTSTWSPHTQKSLPALQHGCSWLLCYWAQGCMLVAVSLLPSAFPSHIHELEVHDQISTFTGA